MSVAARLRRYRGDAIGAGATDELQPVPARVQSSHVAASVSSAAALLDRMRADSPARPACANGNTRQAASGPSRDCSATALCAALQRQLPADARVINDVDGVLRVEYSVVAPAADTCGQPAADTCGQPAARGARVVDQSLVGVALALLTAAPPVLLPDDGRDVLLLDTETTGLSGGAGTTAFVIGTTRVSVRERAAHVRLWLLLRPAAEAACLAGFASTLADNVRLVTYNGASYDLPLLATRLGMHRMRDAMKTLAALPHVDLLAPTRRAFATRWPDCRLASLERNLLGIERHDDLPGAMAPLAWQAWLNAGETSTLARVVTHNLLDLDAMLVALPRLAAVLSDPVAHGAAALAWRDTAMAREAFASSAERQRAASALFRYLGHNADALVRGEDWAALRMLARLAARFHQPELARSAWSVLHARGDSQATVALAKLAEHQFRDYDAALKLVCQLLECSPAAADHLQRQRRLLRKAGVS